MKEPLLISACLLGVNCKYNGGNNLLPAAESLRERWELIPVCPECMGGLPCPRDPAERVGQRVVSKAGRDVTEAFRSGAEQALEIARETGKVAWQNVWFALAVKFAVMVLGLFGHASMWLAVFADSGVAMLCVLNSIRMLYKKG